MWFESTTGIHDKEKSLKPNVEVVKLPLYPKVLRPSLLRLRQLEGKVEYSLLDVHHTSTANDVRGNFSVLSA